MRKFIIELIGKFPGMIVLQNLYNARCIYLALARQRPIVRSRYFVLTTYSQLSRGHAEIKKDGGFKAWAHTNKLPPNLSLWDHCKVKHAKHGFGNLANDGYVGMTSDVQVTLDWVTNYIEDTSGTTTIYKIAQDRNLLACADVLEKRMYFY